MSVITEQEKQWCQEKLQKEIGIPVVLHKKKHKSEFENAFRIKGYYHKYHSKRNIAVDIKNDNIVFWQITDKYITFQDILHLRQIHLGDRVICTDPFYKRDAWCNAKLENVRPGRYNVFSSADTIDSQGHATYILKVMHESVQNDSALAWKKGGDLGVDSAKMCIFADEHYCRLNGSEEDFEADKKAVDDFLNECCCAVNKGDCSVIERDVDNSSIGVGVVCRSGKGDGVYPLYTAISKADGKIIAIRIVFF